MRDTYFDKLSELYQSLETQLPKHSGNPCGDCKACCTADELNSHNVTALELDYLETKVGSEKIDEFRKFLNRDGQIAACPYYSGGCTVYEHRPYSCRTFGHYRREDTPFPEVCVFRGQEHIFKRGEYRETLPESDKLVHLSRHYWAHRLQRADAEQTHYQAAGLEEPLAKAIEFLKQGDVSKALEHMELDKSDDPFTLYCKSLVYEEAGKPELAFQVLELALAQATESPDLWYRIACVLLGMGDAPRAGEALERAIRFHPGHGQALGLLGLLRLAQNNINEAIECLQRACDIEPENTVFQARLKQARDAQ